MEIITVPAETWERLTECYSAHLFIEMGRKAKVISVRAERYESFLYTSFSVAYGSWGHSHQPYIKANRLVPESMYKGETTAIYHDEEAIESGKRERGDHSGLIVSVNGQLMVCADKVKFLKGLPGTAPLSLSKAQAYDQECKAEGWRALHCKGWETEWSSLNGHPVVRYQRDGKTEQRVLFWAQGKKIHEMSIANDVELSPATELEIQMNHQLSTEPLEQLAMF